MEAMSIWLLIGSSTADVDINDKSEDFSDENSPTKALVWTSADTSSDHHDGTVGRSSVIQNHDSRDSSISKKTTNRVDEVVSSKKDRDNPGSNYTTNRATAGPKRIPFFGYSAQPQLCLGVSKWSWP